MEKNIVSSDLSAKFGYDHRLSRSSLSTLNDTKNIPNKLSSEPLGSLKEEDFVEEILFVGKRSKGLKKELLGTYKNKYKSSDIFCKEIHLRGKDEDAVRDHCDTDLIKDLNFINFEPSQKSFLSCSRKKGLTSKTEYSGDDAEIDYIENITAGGYLNDELLKQYESSSAFLDNRDVVIHGEDYLSEKTQSDIHNRFGFDASSIPRSDCRVWRNNRISLSCLNKRFKKGFDLQDDNYFSLYNDNIQDLKGNIGRKKHQKRYRKASVSKDIMKHEKGDKKDKIVGKTYRELLLRVNDIILRFLSDSSLMELDLVPMDSRARKWVHILADAYSIMSKSFEQRELRHVVLYKTTRVHDNYSKSYVARILRTLNSRQYDSRVSSMKDLKKSKDNGGKFSRNKHKYRYQDGDIVGKDASEIDKDNKGRMMLERLGWIAGSGLGAADNKGIEVPIMAVIKTTKLGLG